MVACAISGRPSRRHRCIVPSTHSDRTVRVHQFRQSVPNKGSNWLLRRRNSYGPCLRPDCFAETLRFRMTSHWKEAPPPKHYATCIHPTRSILRLQWHPLERPISSLSLAEETERTHETKPLDYSLPRTAHEIPARESGMNGLRGRTRPARRESVRGLGSACLHCASLRDASRSSEPLCGEVSLTEQGRMRCFQHSLWNSSWR
jgi:hypothetical protein